MVRKTHHIVSNPSGGWNVMKGGAARASVHTDTKADAMTKGRQISINQKSELVIHGKNGKIQNSNSYGNDPCPPRDTK